MRGVVGTVVISLSLVATVLVARPLLDAAAQDTAERQVHQLVGTWVIDRNVATTADAPVVVVFTEDGAFIDAGGDAAGRWEAMGPDSATFSLVLLLEEPELTGYLFVAGQPIAFDASGDAFSQLYATTIVAADGTVLEASPLTESRAQRLPLIGEDGIGQPLTQMPVWVPAPTTDATPTA